MELINPDINANSFKSRSGVEYIIYPSVGTGRFPLMEICMIEIQNGISVSGHKKELSDLYDSLNKGKMADASVRAHNMINGADRILNMQLHPVFKLCTLFICPEGENRETWSEAEATEKVKDWAGIDDAFFLTCARRFLHRYFKDSGIDFPNTLPPIRDDHAESKSAK